MSYELCVGDIQFNLVNNYWGLPEGLPPLYNGQNLATKKSAALNRVDSAGSLLH